MGARAGRTISFDFFCPPLAACSGWLVLAPPAPPLCTMTLSISTARNVARTALAAASPVCTIPQKIDACATSSVPSASYTDGPRPPSENNSAVDDNFGWQPNQATVIFQRMEETCPDALKSYARCVIEKQNSGALVQGACEEPFQAVMNCFRSVR